MSSDKILIIDDDEHLRKALKEVIRREGYEVVAASRKEEALEMIPHVRFSVALVDIRMDESHRDGIEILGRIKEIAPEAAVLIMTAYPSVETAVEAMKLGAADYISKPFSYDQLMQKLRNLAGPPGEEERYFGGIVTRNKQMLKILETVRNVAATQSTVLIRGETGTGKELVARALHNYSPRADGPFVAVNCAALPDMLLESELFGYERGAFTGAVSRKLGKFELAHGGTLFLDEITELTPKLQAKLLRVLEQKEVDRLGGREPIPVDVRVIATTNEDIEACVAEGRFRDDLYYRVTVVTIELPPLRERKDDIPLLARHFLKIYSRQHCKEIVDLSEGAIQKLMDYHWPGNVRQLRNIIEQAVILCPDEIITEMYINPERRRRSSNQIVIPIGTPLHEAEKMIILKTLEACGNVKTKAAELLKITPRTIRNKLKAYAKEEGRRFEDEEEE
ncbi:sigma-54-dependent Fis family transcriptional regulator [Candidatus Poribacteria bacterium]|nr:sigma-54-dependent Fis family transcriptional regulator [Candidatus Poribacteria bacterium]